MKSNYNVSFQQGVLGTWCIAQWYPLCQNEELAIIIPPFAEEMNRTRRPFSLLAQELAQSGYTVWQPDFYGTGDAAGDFSQIDLTCWMQDLSNVIKTASFTKVSFIACRFGVQILNAFLQQGLTEKIEISRIVLWQPQWDIRVFWQQFWRLGVVSDLASNNKSKQNAEEILLKQGWVDIQGYRIPQCFFEQTQQLVDTLVVLADYPIFWFECNELNMTPPNVITQYNQLKNVSIFQQELHVLPVKYFWLTQEATDVSLLLDATLNIFRRGMNV